MAAGASALTMLRTCNTLSAMKSAPLSQVRAEPESREGLFALDATTAVPADFLSTDDRNQGEQLLDPFCGKSITQRRNIADALAMPGLADIEFEPPRVSIEPRPGDSPQT